MEKLVTSLILNLGRTRLLDSTRVFERLGASLNIDHLPYAYNQRGILKWRSLEHSGERYFLERILPHVLDEAPIIFDVGANCGDYTDELAKLFCTAKIHCFEPNPEMTKAIRSRLGDSVTIAEVALSSEEGTLNLYTPTETDAPSHGSLYGGVLENLHGYAKVATTEVMTTTLDQYCEAQEIKKIDFLKVDTEGAERDVLVGAKRLIASDGLPLIQFEFNEMNVESRVFLKDFFQLLPQHRFYRLDTQGLLPIKYSPREEIFQFQNIIASTAPLPD
ncbi:MAG TPA: methyltransferase FkbM [Planctomycetaceae bacterium]|nr:methyltransferase FkbM [Planctomycetaceae bacterium]